MEPELDYECEECGRLFETELEKDICTRECQEGRTDWTGDIV